MATDNVSIANLAIKKLGGRKITSLTQSGSNEASAINDVYNDILDEVLSEHPWSFAQKRVALDYTVPDDKTRTIDDNIYPQMVITGATQADPVVITAVAHGYDDGDWVKVTGVVGMTELNGNFYIVANSTTDTFEIQTTSAVDIDGTGYVAYVSGGVIQKAFVLPMTEDGISVVYDKPSDLIKPIMKSDDYALIKVEQDKIMSNVEGLKIIYTWRNTTVSHYFAKFIQSFATRLASEIAFDITNSVSKAQALMKIYYETVLPSAVSVDSTQNTPQEAQQDEWLNAMHHAGSQYKTTGATWHPV